ALLERYSFYVAPLIVIVFLVAVRDGLASGVIYRKGVFALIAISALLPATGFFGQTHTQAPTLMAYDLMHLAFGRASLPAAAIFLAPLAATALRPSRNVVAVTLVILAVVAGGASAELARLTRHATPLGLGLDGRYSLVTSFQTPFSRTMK